MYELDYSACRVGSKIYSLFSNWYLLFDLLQKLYIMFIRIITIFKNIIENFKFFNTFVKQGLVWIFIENTF